MNVYEEMKQRHQEEFNKFPMKFAFSDKQFEKGMRELGLEPSETDKIYAFRDAGGFYRRSDSPALLEMLDRHHDEMQDVIAADKTGDGFIFNMFLYELENHEFGYSGSVSDALEALGYTYDQIAADPRLMRGLEKAKKQAYKNSASW